MSRKPSRPVSHQRSGEQHRTIRLLQGLKAGTTDPALLTPATRRQLVAHMMADGFATAEIAEMLGVGDRTVERDRQALREELALHPSANLVPQLVGRLYAEAELAIQRIRRSLRDKDIEPGVKIQGERSCFEIYDALVGRFQQLGYLPTATQKVEADLTHHLGPPASLDDLQQELERVREIERAYPDAVTSPALPAAGEKSLGASAEQIQSKPARRSRSSNSPPSTPAPARRRVPGSAASRARPALPAQPDQE